MGTSQHQITLENGYTDTKGVTHNEIIFGHRVNGNDLVEIEGRTDGLSADVSNCWLIGKALLQFGTLQRPNFIDALLSLDSLELEEVEQGHDEFLRRTSSPPLFISEDTVRLGCGFTLDGERYNTLTVGRLLTGYDLMRADRMRLTGVMRNFYLLGLQVMKISQSDGEKFLDEPLPVEAFYAMDVNDIGAIRQTAELFKAKRRQELQTKRQQRSTEASEENEAVN